ncbi:hypothetical protein FJNA_08160 [Thermus sp. FJN-A]
MPLFRRRPAPSQEVREAELASLREAVARLEGEVALLREKNAQLAREAGPALKENAVLRYELFKCQQDRQVLEFHLSGLRSELRATLNLLRRWAPGEPPKEVPLLTALLELLEVGRRLGVEVQALEEAEEAARSHLGSWSFHPERFLALRLAGLLAALERLVDEGVWRAEHPADGLRAYPPPLERVRETLAGFLAEAASGQDTASEGGGGTP